MVAVAENLPRANTRQGFDPREFVTVPNVPHFKEHETITKNGKRLKFTRAELEAVINRCNRRIQETGDYVPLVIGHTPDKPGGKMPEIVGYAGPFRLGTIGQGTKTCYAILGDEHYLKNEAENIKRYPRRSPELWVEDTYDEMFFDPIALLGAEAPRLDLGLVYSAHRNGRQVERYSAVSPGPGNVFVPSDKYAGETQPNEGTMLGPEDIRQIVDAISQLPWAQFARQQMEASAGDPSGVPGAAVGAPSAAAPVPPPPAAPVAPPPVAPAAPPMPEASGPPAGPPGPPEPEANGPPSGPPEPEKEKDMAQQYGCGGTMPHAGKPEGAKAYGANPPEGSVDGSDSTAKGSATGSPDPAAGSYQQKYARVKAENDDLRERFSKLEARMEQERVLRVDAERAQKLQELQAQGYSFDIDKEVERCKYGKMNDDAFNAHYDAIVENYQRVAVGQWLPISRSVPQANGSEKYSKAHHDKALRIAKQRRAERKSDAECDYNAILEEVSQGKL